MVTLYTFNFQFMEEEKSTFDLVFVYLYYLMLTADKIVDRDELKPGNKS